MNYIKKIIEQNEEFKDVYLPDLLMEAEPLNCFYVDTLPISVCEKNAEKLDQLDVYLKDELHAKTSILLKKLWLYNDTFLKSDLLVEFFNSNNDFKTDKIIVKNIKDFFPKQNIKSVLRLSDLKQLDLILQLSFEDKIDLMLIFNQFQLILIASWSCLFAFFNDLSNKELVEKMINLEGLYLRPFVIEK